MFFDAIVDILDLSKVASTRVIDGPDHFFQLLGASALFESTLSTK